MLRVIALNEIYSIVFFITSMVFLIIGVHVISLNIENVLNRTFFYMTLFLGIWAFSYSIANSALTEVEALLWNRASVFGWGVMYSIQLIYFLHLTGRNKIFTNKAVYLLILLPAVINLVVFSLDPGSAAREYSLIKTEAGWVDIHPNNLTNYYFYIYYIVNSAISLASIWTWERIKTEKNARKTAVFITVSLFLGLSLGSITDVVFKNSMQDIRPHLGVVFALIPVASLFYSTKKYGIAMASPETRGFVAGRLLTAENRSSFFRMLSYIFIGGSVAYIMLDFLMLGKEITSVLKFSGIVLFLGLNIWLIPYYRIGEKLEDFLIGAIMVSIAPLLYYHFKQHGYSSVAWTVTLFLMAISTVFRSRGILLAVLLSGAIAEIYTQLNMETFVVLVGKADFQQRTAVYFLLGGIIFYISYLYRSRLKEHEDQIKLQGVISRVSSNFTMVSPDNIGKKTDEMLKICSEFLEIDHSYFFRLKEDLTEAKFSNEWIREDMQPAIGEINSLKTDSFPWFLSQLKAGKVVYIEETEKLPDEASSEKSFLQSQGVKSMLSMPVLNRDSLLGFLGFGSLKGKKHWSWEHHQFLGIMANILSDSIVKTEAENRINSMAYFDPLTGLPNRTYFVIQLEKMISTAQREEKLLGILFLDLDLFKAINDTMGHETGDKLLVTVSERLAQSAGKSDMVCRFGGDEFLVMLPLMEGEDHIRRAAERIMKSFDEPVYLKGQKFSVTASCGVALYPTDGKTADTLIKNADLAMYESKKSGKNQYTFCNDLMKEELKNKVELSNDLYWAMERDELLLYYQPQVCMETNRIIGVEALLRWKHPKRGMVPPGVFIPLAEQTGLIHNMGEWVLNTALRKNREWQDRGFDPVVMAVNISVEQFRSNRLLGIVESALLNSRLEAKYLELEITESIAINEPDYIIEVLHRLKGIGVSISIDDFGTEYSSMSRLKELPVDRLKIAMEFIQGINKGKKDEAIASVIISLAKGLGLRVIAEGVEEESQYKFLKEKVCNEVQGYYFYKPMPAEEIEKIMQAGE